MFKKPVDVKTVQRLSGADKKKLRRTAKERFPQASDADLDAILPPKGEITLAKYPTHALVYAIEGEFPMIFNIDARGHDLFPTVYALWKVPHLLPAFTLKGGEVSRYVIGGADLMFPGISIPPEGFPSFGAGQPWAVKVPGNPAPIAVWITTMSSTEALKAGLHGKALRILHYYRDMDSADGRYVPNEGFFEDIVVEDPNFVSTSQSPDSAEGTLEVTHESEDAAVDSSGTADPGVHNEATEEITDGINELKLPEDKSNEQISAKEDKYKKEVILLGFNRKHPDYMSFKPEKRVQEPVEQEKAVAESSVTKQLEVAEIYKPSSHVKPIFMAVEADMEKYYSASEASDVVFRYIEKENLVKPTDKAKVILDVTLCDALYKGAIKKGSAYPTEIHKKDLGSTLLNRMQVHHKKKFACSTTTAELPGKKGQYEVLVQGGVIDNLAKHLVDHYGVPKRYIEVYDKTKR
ncbi:eukaryotic translation initiation factor 2D [Panicum miliaceum]|uniref:Eukaryotic translation initiation factor 2D n=1 Tax=Panicum miliaceum TaxID=4540 RepID=A0A3L6RV33_PANMI|nr:eukaryotic translation initiation factor 2D [Panicum miliaceum]